LFKNLFKNQRSRENWYAFLFLAPFFIIFLIFTLYPILYTLYLAFTSYDGFSNPVFIGIQNFQRVFTDPTFYTALKNTIVMWLIGLIPQMLFAFVLAAVFHYSPNMKGRGIYQALFYVPRVVTAVAISALFSQILSFPNGVLNQILLEWNIISEPFNFLNNEAFAQGTVGFIHWWQFYGSTMIMVMAGMTAIPYELYEAADIDGANTWTKFWKITMPLLRPVTLFVFLNSFIGGMQSFDIQQLLTDGMGSPRGSLQTVVMYLYNQGFLYSNFGYAAAISYYLFLFIAIASAILFVVRKRREERL
jgi:multiple sugar transport system permease protein